MERRSASASLVPALVSAGFVLLAALLYQPWRPSPFPLHDFAGLLWLLRPANSISESFMALMTAYTTEGRFQPVLMGWLSLHWSVFGSDPTGWQWSRFLLMSAAAALTALLARRLGASTLAAIVSAGLLVCASGAQQSWFLLQIPEPVATLFLLIGAVLASTYQEAHRWITVAVCISLFVIVAVLTKEILIVAAPFVVAIALCRNARGEWTAPQRSPRNTALVAIVALSTILFAIVPVLAVRSAAAADSYAARYALGVPTFDQLSNVSRAIMLPVTRVPWFPANVLFLGVIVFGWLWLLRRSANRGRVLIAAIAVLSLPLAGIAIYLGWPGFPGYYATPFVIGSALLLAFALTSLESHPRRIVAVAAYAATVGVLSYGALLNGNGARADGAIRRTDAAVVDWVRSRPRGREIIMAVRDPARSGSLGNSVRLYALATGSISMPPARDLSCADAAAMLDGLPAGVVVVVFREQCGELTAATRTPSAVISHRYTEIDWRTFRPTAVQVSATLWTG